MGSRVGAYLIVLVVLSPYLHASEVDPREVIQTLRAQMKKLKTLKAEYTVDSVYGASRTPMTARVTYVKDNDKFCIVETQTDPNGRQVLQRTVYNGLDIKQYRRASGEGGQAQGAILPADHRTIKFTDDDLMSAASFSLVSPGSDERFAEFDFEFRGTELINGRNCFVVVFITPYLPGHKAFNYLWVETEGSRHVVRRNKCLIDDRLGMLLYEMRYGYDSQDGYPFPTEITYRRYDIDSRGYRDLDYEKLMCVQTLQINEPIDSSEFSFTFPEGTVVNAAPPTVSPAELKDPNPARVPDRNELPFDPNETQPDPTIEFPFPRGQFPLFVPVRFGPRTYDFVLDTGCTRTIFDLSFRPLLGAAKSMREVSTAANPVVIQVFVAPRAFVGPFNIADCKEVACANLKGFAAMLGREVHGILGMDILRKHIVQVDFDEGRITFLDGKEDNRSDWGQELPITYNRMGMPQMKLVVGGLQEQDFTIDTGYAGSGALARDGFGRLVAEGNLEPVDMPIATIAGVAGSRQVRLRRVTAEPFEYQGLIFDEGNANVVGTDFLSRHVITFDFPHDKLYLKKGRAFEKPDEAGMCGVGVIRSEGRTVVHAVYEGEPAAKAGIKAGDVILKLQGKEVSTYAIWEIRDLLRSGHGKEISMTIQRGHETKEVVVVLERSL